MIKKMLTYDPKKRMTALEAINHEWLKSKQDHNRDREVTQQALLNLSKFRADEKLQQAAITFIVQQMATKDDLSDLQRAFK